jgi:hypothetical protein
VRAEARILRAPRLIQPPMRKLPVVLGGVLALIATLTLSVRDARA